MNTRQKSSHALSVLPGALFMCLLFKNVWVRMNNQFYYSKKKSASCSAYRFFRQPPFQVQIPGSTFQNEKNPQAFQLTDFSGGKRGIRTLGGFMAHTRFPVVRLRPAQPSFHVEVLTRFELVNEGFADLCLTTWPQHQIWSGLRGSNSLPPPWQGGALPDELKPQIVAQL